MKNLFLAIALTVAAVETVGANEQEDALKACLTSPELTAAEIATLPEKTSTGGDKYAKSKYSGLGQDDKIKVCIVLRISAIQKTTKNEEDTARTALRLIPYAKIPKRIGDFVTKETSEAWGRAFILALAAVNGEGNGAWAVANPANPADRADWA